MMDTKWQRRMILLARHVAQWSRDPSTKVGAVIVDHHRRVVSLGYNGFPRGVKDTDSRYNVKSEKYPRVVHAEANAILTASRNLEGATIFIDPLPPCAECAKLIIQAGVHNVCFVADGGLFKNSEQHKYQIAEEMFDEASVLIWRLDPFIEVDDPEDDIPF